LILIAVVVATGGVYLYYARKPNVYTASTSVYVTVPGNPVTGVQAAPPTDRNIADEASLLDSQSNAAQVAHTISYKGSPSQLLAQVSITSKQGEDFVQITAQSGSGEQAAAIANAFAKGFVNSLTNAYLSQIRDGIRLDRASLAQAPPGPAGQITRGDLTNELNTLKLALSVPTTIAQQVSLAQPPSAPSSPKPLRNALFALILSLLGAIAVCYGFERFDRRLKQPEELERAFGSPLLAVLPHADDPAPTKGGAASLGTDFREPFRVLRTNVELASVDAPPRTIVVSSAMPGEGKSTVVRNLALAFRETGKRVALVDLDLRHPALGGLFGAPFGAGMTDVLRQEISLDDALLEVSVNLPALDELMEARTANVVAHGANGSNGHNGGVGTADHISLLLGGARPANPPAVLASDAVVEVLNELRDRNDVVLIDSAPVLAVADTVPLLRYADAALFVGRLGVTSRDTVRHLNEFLARVPDLNVLGVVANDLSRLEAGAYGYGYGGYTGEPKPERRRRKAPAESPV
jgi:Mrp family chromosome partitioning ATPase/capsular polysaccharide biosynthesis protein